MTDVVIVDYGAGNLRSAQRAFEHLGARAVITRDPAVVRAAGRLVLPGDGAFGDCMASLIRHRLVDPVREQIASGRPFLGICVGMQLLFNESEEFGMHAGLGLLRGRVRAIAPFAPDGGKLRVPHIGWTPLRPPAGRIPSAWSSPLMADVPIGAAVYFLHSFAVDPADPADRVADADYGGATISAVVARDNVAATQFHPEKSGPAGLAILRRFLRPEAGP